MNAAQQAATAFLLPSLCFCFITKKLITVEIPLFFRLSLRGSSSCLFLLEVHVSTLFGFYLVVVVISFV